MQKRTFVKNAAILTITALLLRTIGIFFRIFIAGQIGAEGMGLHALIFTVYTFAGALATAGLSLAVTRLITEDVSSGGRVAAKNILKKAILLSLCLGCGAMAILCFGADTIANLWLHDARAALSLRILSAGLPPMSVSACFKGYFMARRNAKTPSDSQMFEQVIRFLAIVLLLKPMTKYGLAAACAAIVLGNAVSEFVACLYLAFYCKKDCASLPSAGSSKPHILPRLLAVFMPVAFTGHINTALHMTENLLVPRALSRFTADTTLALSQFGMLKGMALPVLFFPASFLSALSALLVPEMSEYGAKNQKRSIARTAEFTLRITILSSVFIGGLFMAYPNQIAQILYKNADVGLYIAYLAPIVPFMYLESIATGLLHGLGQQMATLKYNLANSAVRISAVLLVVPHYGIRGFLWIMILSNLYTSLSCLRRLLKVTHVHLHLRKYILFPVVVCTVSLLLCHVYNRLGSGLFYTLGGLGLFAVCFVFLSCLMGILCPDDFSDLRKIFIRKQKQ